jgi:hypothetical protein
VAHRTDGLGSVKIEMDLAKTKRIHWNFCFSCSLRDTELKFRVL